MSAKGSEPGKLPQGVVTFLLTDVADSTRLWTDGGPEAASSMARQAEIIADAVATHGGIRPLEQGEGDSSVAVFERASDALAAAVDAQLALAREPWGEQGVRVRMAVHTGEAEFRDEQTYGGAAIIRCARLREFAEGGQVLVSAATAEVAAERLPPGASLVPVGKVSLRGLPRAERVYQLVHEELAAVVADLGRRRDRLGIWPTRLIGRARERQEVGALLEDARLITITGAGGAGKTRLAHAIAADLSSRFEDVVWVELAQTTSDADVATAVVKTCGAREAPGVELLDVLAAFLEAKDLLLVLDNCEHLLDGCAALVAQILRRTPRIRILTTSREPLAVTGEVTWRIPSLEVPPDQPVDPASVGRFDAALLFLDRAQAADPTFVLDDMTAADVAAICRRLDGLPLAIELAAARLRSMTLRAVTEGLGDRFRLLTGGARTALPRQQALLASVEWSYGLLDDDEQQLLRRLAVFAAPFTIEAAEAVAAEGGADRLGVFDLVSRLVDKSLVQCVDGRYRLLETIRHFALERARDEGELERLRDAHLRWFGSRAGHWRLDRELVTEGMAAEIDVEAPDLLGALEWSLHRGSDPVVELLWPLGRRWVAQSRYAEASQVSNSVLGRFEPGTVGWLEALAPVAGPLLLGGDASWVAPAEAAVAEQGGAVDELTRCHLEWAAMNAPTIFVDSTRRPRLRSLMEQGRLLDNRPIEFGAAAMLAYNSSAGGSVDEAARLCEWLGRRLPDDAELRVTLDVARAYLALLGCDFESAWRCVSNRVQCRPPELWSAICAGLVGAYTEDRGRIAVGLDALEWSGSAGGHGFVCDGLRAFLAILDGDLEEARARLDPSRVAPGFEGQSPVSERLRVQLALAGGDAEAAQARWEILRPLLDGDALQPYGAASLHLVLADVATHAGESRQAEDAVHCALGIATSDLPIVTVDALELLAVLLAGRNRATEAARILGAAESFRERTCLRFCFPVRKVQIEELRPELCGDDVAAGARLSLAEAVTLARGARGKRGRPSFGWDSLTPTECRVVELVSEGRSNAEIADKMLVGVATVKTHLVHVYEKLGIRSRAELAAAAVRREAPC